MRFLLFVIGVWAILQRVVLPSFFFILSLFTAPEDTAEVIREARVMLDRLNGNPAVDVLIILLGILCLAAAASSGNWRIAIASVFAKKRLLSLAMEAERVSEDLSNLITDRKRQKDELSFRQTSAQNVSPMYNNAQELQYIQRHMIKCTSLAKRLKRAGYCEDRHLDETLGTTGAIWAQMEMAAKTFYHQAQEIRADLNRHPLDILISPRLPEGIETRKRQ